MTTENIYVIIVAAGSGSRFGGPLPKQFCNLGGRPVVMRTIEAFSRALVGAHIVLVISEECEPLWARLCNEYSFDSPVTVYGGKTRFESVRNAMRMMPEGTGYVMVHDGARPFPPAEFFGDYISAISEGRADGVVPAVALTDSIREVADGGTNRSADRSRFRAVQTPQVFNAAMLKGAYDTADEMTDGPFTDDASLLTAMYPESVIELGEGSYKNIKITNPGDMALAEFYLNH